MIIIFKFTFIQISDAISKVLELNHVLPFIWYMNIFVMLFEHIIQFQKFPQNINVYFTDQKQN